VGAAVWLIRRRFRQRWFALVSVGLIVMLGATGAFVAVGAADRTSTAYSHYLERSDVSDVVINPSLSNAAIDTVIRDLPGVRSATRDVLFTAILGDGAPRTVRESRVETSLLQVRGSPDGRYTTSDRPAIREGRLPRGRNEALVNVELAEDQGIAVGDVVPVSFGRPADQLLLDLETVVAPLGVEHLTVVGVGTFPDEVLPDGVYPRQRIIVSPDIARRYDCLPEVPATDVSFEEAVAALYPADCATSYSYYSLEVDGGARAISSAFAAMLASGAEIIADLPPEALEGYFPVATTTAQEQRRVERSTRPTVAGLGVLGAAAAAITVIVLGLAVARELRRTAVEQRQWWHLGLSTADRMLVVLVPLLAAVLAALAFALVLAWFFSGIAPVGLVRSIDPSPSLELSSLVWIVALALGVVCAAGIAALAFGAARRVRPRPVRRRRRVSSVQRFLRGSTRPAIDDGIRAAYGGNRGTGIVVASGALAAALFLAATVFSTSLLSTLDTPAEYGWPWDVGLMGGLGYGEVDPDAASSALDGRDDVERWTGLGFNSSATVDGTSVLSVVGLDQVSDVDVTVVEGQLPGGARQVALGRKTADELGVRPGDEVELGGEGIATDRATVTGIVVLPALGPALAERTGPGTGMLLPVSALEPDAAASALSFIGIDLAAGAEPQPLLADIREEFPSWDRILGEAALEFTAPVRPPEIVNAESMQAVPVLVGVLLVATAGVGLVVAVVVSVRSRQRDLATLRALGFTGRQLRGSVRVQTVATMVGALVIGVPLGIFIGRVIWRLFAEELGIVTDPSMPVLRIGAVVVGALVVAVVAAEIPARMAARTHPAAALRSE
jgi:putative ABC transport system permease protein